MNSNAKILGIAEYHPSYVEGNEKYIEHFDKFGIDVRKLYNEVAIRKYRYEIHNEDKTNVEEYENSKTMQIAAAKRVLGKCGLEGSDMDAIIVATQVPEHLVPTASIFVHEAIQGKMDCYCYDINANCIAMLSAIRQAYAWIYLEEKINRVLIVGGDFSSYTANEKDSGLHGSFGDAAAAMILERTKEDSGLISNDYFVNSVNANVTVFPSVGMYRVIKGEDGTCFSGPTELNFPIVIEKLNAMIEKAGISTDDISAFCFSQSAMSTIKEIAKGVGAPLEKCCYIGEEYGYTGVTSPILALNRMVEEGKVKQGDYVLLWTVGSGTQHTMLLIKY